MKHFHYSGRQGEGQGTFAQGWIMAEDREDALEQLRKRQVHPYKVAPGPGFIALKAPVSELLITLRELGSLRRSGMAIDESVQAVIDTTDHPGLAAAWRQVLEMIQSGLPLSDSMGAMPEYFPRYAVPLVRLGEANGQIAEAISLTADRLDEESRLKSEIRSAMTYPSFLLVVCVAVLLFLFTVVIPRFGAMVDAESGGSMMVLLAISGVLREYFWLWGGATVAGIFYAAWLWRTGRLQAALWRQMQRLPLVSDIVQSWEVVQFSGSMARLLPGGVSVLDALHLSGEALGRDEKRKLLRECAVMVRQGEALGTALAKCEVFPKLVIQMISVGEKSAHLAGSLEEVSRLYERRMRDGIQRLLSVLEPAVIVIMGVAVGGIMVSLLSSIISMNDIPI
jgi:general secretion pathway protein F